MTQSLNMENKKLISNWTCDDVKLWLKSEGFGEYAQLLCDEHGIDGEVLLTITVKDLRDPPLQLKKLCDIKKLEKSLKQLHKKWDVENHILLSEHENGKYSKKTKRNEQIERDGMESSDLVSSDENDESYVKKVNTRKKVFKPEYNKLLVSFGYAFATSWITAYVMVICHEKVPDKKKYPPLPDVFLDNIPLIPYAFKMAEACGLLLNAMFCCILLFHKHRAIVLRRFFSIASTVFLLRSVTMFVTSLSVPGEHLECTAMYNSKWQRITRATEIVTGLGMSLTGLQTCGDYMFSGHTAYLTLFNHLITEYSPRKMHYIHTISWVLNLFGVFFVLAAHEHYSIDVVIALYITSRIFLYYHVLANTRSYFHSKRIKIWFPLLSYFECNVPGKVPNEFEWPLDRNRIGKFFNQIKKSKSA
uniref:Sphingomyelin synthase-related protein 1-like n=1 Tax=Phallusia mammillata TaxID=59560 RepID=A0A6F9DS74_9ASCI|nr:sphingomyelin synthase-related protein 1-like [Phallusia mammillata]